MESNALETFSENYINGDDEQKKKFSLQNDGLHTIDVDKKIMRLTSDKDGTGKAFKVIRGVGGVRKRSSESKKFT